MMLLTHMTPRPLRWHSAALSPTADGQAYTITHYTHYTHIHIYTYTHIQHIQTVTSYTHIQHTRNLVTHTHTDTHTTYTGGRQ